MPGARPFRKERLVVRPWRGPISWQHPLGRARARARRLPEARAVAALTALAPLAS